MTRKLKSRRWQANSEGFTLVELLVVLGIIALLAALVAPQVIGYLSGARTDTAKAQIRNIESAVELFYLDTGAYPTADQGLDGLVEAPDNAVTWRGPYLKKRDGLMDPWGKPYQYRFPGGHSAYDLFSLGRDNKEGGTGEAADVANW